MVERATDHGRLSRRAALAGAALAIGAAASANTAGPAAAQQKISQAIAKYQGRPNGANHCGACQNFQAPNACKFVQGQISANGWCSLFTPL